jgi:AraC-like DNA-binding protein
VPIVAHFWWVRWSRTEPFFAETLPHPSVHLVFERSGGKMRAEIAGVSTARFARELLGRGEVFGIKLRPAASHALLPAARLAERVVPIGSVLGDAGDDLARAVFEAPTFEAKIAVATPWLESHLTALPADVATLRDLVERMAVDRSLLRAEDAAAAIGVDLRTLQRRFRRYVGASPKWVIQRYRLHEAAERLKLAEPPSLAALAVELGYADQAHFARDFKAMVGRTPREFASMESRGP